MFKNFINNLIQNNKKKVYEIKQNGLKNSILVGKINKIPLA